MGSLAIPDEMTGNNGRARPEWELDHHLGSLLPLLRRRAAEEPILFVQLDVMRAPSSEMTGMERNKQSLIRSQFVPSDTEP